jgi:hypothetical protein
VRQIVHLCGRRGLFVDGGQPGLRLLLLFGKTGLGVRLLRVQVRDLFFGGETLLVQFGKLGAQSGQTLLGGGRFGLVGLLFPEQGANGGVEQTALVFHLPERLCQSGEAVLVATQFVDTGGDGLFLATELGDL